MNEPTANVPQGIDEMSVGMEVREGFSFTEADLKNFSELTNDRAPVHFSDSFASVQGYSKRLVFGLFIAARFSGILGMKLPGPYTVIHSARFEMTKPVYLGETVEYLVKVKQCSRATKTVLLDLAVVRSDGELVLRGTAQCGFSR